MQAPGLVRQRKGETCVQQSIIVPVRKPLRRPAKAGEDRNEGKSHLTRIPLPELRRPAKVGEDRNYDWV